MKITMKAHNIKFDSRVFESEKELAAYRQGYNDAMNEVDTYYTDEDIEKAEEEGYYRGYTEANEEKEDHPESNRITNVLAKNRRLHGDHWKYVLEKAVLAGDNKALIALIVELETRYG
jgi:hypothetical protein